MQFFTPELYLRFNSSDDNEADLANEEWEDALQAYQKHLKIIRDQMTSQVRALAGNCFHDAELLGYEQVSEPFSQLIPFEQGSGIWSSMAILSIKQGDEIISLIYLLWDHLREERAPENWPFSKHRPHWLYDEVDVASTHRGVFLHRILWSDGRVLEVPFVSVVTHQVPLSLSAEDTARQSA